MTRSFTNTALQPTPQVTQQLHLYNLMHDFDLNFGNMFI